MPPRNYFHLSRLKKLLPFFTFFILFAFFAFKANIIVPPKLHAARSEPRSTRLDHGGTFLQHFIATRVDNRAEHEDGEMVTLELEKISGSEFESKDEFLFGKITMKTKLTPKNDAAGPFLTYYMSSEGEQHDKIDIEIMGNSTGNPYTLHTNVFAQGKGGREKHFFLWFDPTRHFHAYTILWNPKCIIFYVDDIPIREFKNYEKFGVPFPNTRAMRVYYSLLNADDGATPSDDGAESDSSLGPVDNASYSNFTADACIWSQKNGTSSCDSAVFSPSKAWLDLELDVRNHVRMQRIQKSYMIYDYCGDKLRFPNGHGPECGIN